MRALASQAKNGKEHVLAVHGKVFTEPFFVLHIHSRTLQTLLGI